MLPFTINKDKNINIIRTKQKINYTNNITVSLHNSLIMPPKKPVEKTAKSGEKTAKSGEKTASEIYTKKDPISMCRDRPDTFIGSIVNTTETHWTIVEKKELEEEQEESENVEKTSEKTSAVKEPVYIAEKRPVRFNPGLEHCISELITNAIDHSQRTADSDDPVTKIDIKMTNDTFTITNNGSGIPVEKSTTEKIWIPELIFGHMFSGSNYDDTQARSWGGKNGIGAKAANIFSKEFTVETVCKGSHYVQTFYNRLTSQTEPKITKTKVKDYTRITFVPDFTTFGLVDFDTEIDDGTKTDISGLILKRVYDTAVVTSKKVSVFFNGSKVPIKEFKDYCDLFVERDVKKIVYEQDNWSVVVCQNMNRDDSSTDSKATNQISFVNGIFTEDNGSHMDHVMNQIVTKMTALIEDNSKVKKEKLKIKPASVRNSIMVFVKCIVDNPTFDTQTKTKLNTSPTKFPVRCVIPDDVIAKIMKLGILDEILLQAQEKAEKDLAKTTTGSTVKRRITDVPKLDDANWAGIRSKSKECTLILTEGDSAKALVKAGFSVVGTDAWGVFPLRGKLLNVRDVPLSKVSSNPELNNITKILGLKYGSQDYSTLRYGRIMIMTDADHDGAHIKGLLINYFSKFWPGLLHEGFLTTMLTPVVKVILPASAAKASNVTEEATEEPTDKKSKASKKASKTTTKTNKKKSRDNEIDFYDLKTFEEWCKQNDGLKYRQKYYKGLGTSSNEEAKQYFEDLLKLQRTYVWSDDDIKLMELAFDKSKSHDRKDWIAKSIAKTAAGSEAAIDYTAKRIPVENFVNNELVQFSIHSCERSLPSMIDGLKVSQRKVLYGSLMKNMFGPTNEVKVAQLGAYIAEKTHYHHGEVSLQETIVKMAQEFVGSGNLQLLYPSGQFGSRELGGKDNASPRYIFTYLRPFVKLLFNDSDSELLTYNYEDSDKIEPKFYVPILPLALVNGIGGIGTGWSSTVPCFNPFDIIKRIRKLLTSDDPDEPIEPLEPYYKGFRGSIVKLDKNKWKSRGIVEKKSNTKFIIKELPVDMWYESLVEILSEALSNSIITMFTKQTVTVTDVDFNESYDVDEYEVQFASPVESVDAVISLFKLETNINATNMVGFDEHGAIKHYSCPEEILWNHYVYRLGMYDIRRKSLIEKAEKAMVFVSEKMRFIQMVIAKTFVLFERPEADIIGDLLAHNFKQIDGSYDYLLGLRISTFTKEAMAKLAKELEDLNKKLAVLQQSTAKQLWLDDLDNLEAMIGK
jgi:DNA topoisomerase-2